MNTLRYATPVLSSLCLAAAAAGQDLDLSEQRVPIHSAEADPVGGAYGIWAAGSNYKTSFHGAMTFVPFCGRGVDENRTLSWRTESVRVGEVELTSGIRGMRPVGDYRFEYDLGGVVEAYDVRAEGLEQTFVISRRPAAGGDLVVTGAIEGNVTATNREAMHGAVLFADATGNGVIGYGAATAFDALGNTVPVTTAVADGRIELRLAGSWLEQAVFPVVVDPLLSNQLFDVGNDAKDVDVYRDGEQLASNVWVVYSVYASATDVDIYVRRFLDGFSGPGATVFSDLTTTWNAQHGQLAGLGGSGAGKVITVFERDFASGDRRVRWHTHRKNDATLSTGASSVPWQSGTSEWRPDVGGTKSSVPGTVALLVFQREPVSPFAETSNSQVVGLKIDTAISSNGAPVGSVFEFAGSTTDEERPAVNQVSEGGIAFSWLVAWQSHNNLASGKWDVVAQRIAGAFGSNGNARHVAYGSYHEVAPAVAGANGRYVVTYGLRQPLTSKPSSDLATHIAAQRLDWGHGDVNGIRPHAESIVYSGGQNQQQNGAVGFDLETESHWVLTYARTTSGSERLLASKIGYDGLETERRAAYDVPGFQPAPGGVCY
ncbi:MAG: hypothetical protein KDE27_22370, partial [Planctomycetes bacterium]|nr:hypothetical protein [Planctomycetota bacterium]